MGKARDEQLDVSITHVRRLEKDFTSFQGIMTAAQITITILFIIFGDYSYDGIGEENGLMNNYQMYTGIAIMMLVGFGYLMTFLKHYGLGAVGWTLLITCMGVEWSILTNHFFQQAFKHGARNANEWAKVRVSVMDLINANFAVAAFLITFGALIGKVGPKQMCLLVLIESVFYSLNSELLASDRVGITDVGGTIVIHMFGAYYGLAVAYCLGVPRDRGTADQESTYTTDLFSLIGTIFLWLYWPSFVSAPLEQNSPAASRAIINCVLSLVGSTVATFILSARHEQKTSSAARLNPVHIQNSTLAGGVAIGATCNLSMGPGVAIFIGILAGTLSTTGYSYLETFMNSRVGIHDTCGVQFLHGMPSVLGGLASVILAALYLNPDAYMNGKETQWKMQLLSILSTLGIAIGSGLMTGKLLSTTDMMTKFNSFNDSEFWDIHQDKRRVVVIGGIGLTGVERDLYLSESKAGIPNVNSTSSAGAAGDGGGGGGGGGGGLFGEGMVDINVVKCHDEHHHDRASSADIEAARADRHTTGRTSCSSLTSISV